MFISQRLFISYITAMEFFVKKKVLYIQPKKMPPGLKIPALNSLSSSLQGRVPEVL